MASKAFKAIRGGTLSPTRTHLPSSPFGPWHSCCQWTGNRRCNLVLEVFHVQADFLMAETTPYKEKSLEMGTLLGMAYEEESMGVGEWRTRQLICLFWNLKLTWTEFNYYYAIALFSKWWPTVLQRMSFFLLVNIYHIKETLEIKEKECSDSSVSYDALSQVCNTKGIQGGLTVNKTSYVLWKRAGMITKNISSACLSHRLK